MNHGSVLDSNYSQFSDDEKLNYGLKIALARLQTELNRAWYQEPKDFAPKGPETIYKNKLPSYNDISKYQLIDPFCKVHGVNNTSVITNVKVGDILNNSSNASGWGFGDTGGDKDFYHGSITKTVRDNDTNITNVTTHQSGLSKRMFTRYRYWENGLTGKNSSTDGTPGTADNGTHDNKIEPENAILSYVDGELSSSRIWKAYYDNLGKGNSEDQFFTKLITYSSPIKIIDPSNININDYTDIAKAHPFLEVYVQVPTVSTRQSADLANNAASGDSNGTDNIGFFNPVLRQSLGDVEGFKYIIRGWAGQTPKWGDLTYEAGATNNTNILYFLNNPGFILCYGVKDIVNGLNLSYSYPPVISFLKYTGETFADGIISQGLSLPAIANDKDLFVDTSKNTIYRFDASANPGIPIARGPSGEWISIGGGGDTDLNNYYNKPQTNDLFKNKLDASFNNVDVSENLHVGSDINVYGKNGIWVASGGVLVNGLGDIETKSGDIKAGGDISTTTGTITSGGNIETTGGTLTAYSGIFTKGNLEVIGSTNDIDAPGMVWGKGSDAGNGAKVSMQKLDSLIAGVSAGITAAAILETARVFLLGITLASLDGRIATNVGTINTNGTNIGKNGASISDIKLTTDLITVEEKVNLNTMVSDISANKSDISDLSNNKQKKLTCDTDISVNNLTICGDICGNDASFNNVEANGNLVVKGDVEIYGNLDVNTLNYNITNTDITYKNSVINDSIITLGSVNDELYPHHPHLTTGDTGFIFRKQRFNMDSYLNENDNKSIFWSHRENKFMFVNTDSSGVSTHNDNPTFLVNVKEFVDIAVKDISANNVEAGGNLIVKGDISANDASFNNIWAKNFHSYSNNSFYGNIHSTGKSTFHDISGDCADFTDVDVTGDVIVTGKIQGRNAAGIITLGGAYILIASESARAIQKEGENKAGIDTNTERIEDPSGFPIRIINKDPTGTISDKGDAQFDISTNILYVNVDGSKKWQSIQGGGGDASFNNVDISGILRINENPLNLIAYNNNGLTIEGKTPNNSDISINQVTKIIIDHDAGLHVMKDDDNNHVAKITLGSHWKTIDISANGGEIEIDSSSSLVPSGEETLQIIAGENIILHGKGASSPFQSLKISAKTPTLSTFEITADSTEINILDGVTATTAEINILDGVTATTAEINILDGVTATTAEINILDGVDVSAGKINFLRDVSENIQEQFINVFTRIDNIPTPTLSTFEITADAVEINILDGVTATTAEINILDGVTATTAEINILDGVDVSAGKINFLRDVSENIQEQFINVFTRIDNIPTPTLSTFEITADSTEINILDGVTATTAEINILDGVTATTAEINILDGVDVSAGKINFLRDVSENIQEQFINVFTRIDNIPTPTLSTFEITADAVEINILDGVTATTAEINILDGVTATTAEINILDGVDVSAGKINFLRDVSENIQEQFINVFTRIDNIPTPTLSTFEITADAAEINILDGVTATTAEINILNNVDVSAGKINFLRDVSENIQEQFTYISTRIDNFTGPQGPPGKESITLRGGGADDISNNDASLNDTTIGLADQSRSEGQIIYDVSRNIFYEASRSKTDVYGNGDLAFRPLGYSFFRDNMEGQPPAPSFFFFLITPSSIQISWTNPLQYVSGVTNPNDPYNHGISGEFSSTVNAAGNIYFPVVNRIMIQVKNKQIGNYEKWGVERSLLSQDISGISGGYVICAKNHPIPPMKTGVDPYFGMSNSMGRDNKVYELKEFANSIILYKLNSTPENPTIITNITNDEELVSAVKNEPNKELRDASNAGYEIKLWLENGYNSGSMSENDFNIVTLIKDNSGEIINFRGVYPPTAPLDISANIVFNDIDTTENGSTIVELIVKDPSWTTITDQKYNTGSDAINLVGVKIEYANTSSNDFDGNWTDVSNIYFSIIKKNNLNELSTLQTGKAANPNYFSTGIHEINRLNHVTAGETGTTTQNYYYIKLNDSFLNVSNNDMKPHHTFRASYRNASNSKYGDTKQSNPILINEPVQPTINSVKMTTSNQIEINVAEMTSANKTGTGTDNNNNGVFLRTIDMLIKYKKDNENIEIYKNLLSTTGVDDGDWHKKTQTEETTYTFNIPEGSGASSGAISALSSLKWHFQIKVKNNIINEWSPISAFAITDNNIDDTSNNALKITDVSNNNSITDIKFNDEASRNGGIIQLDWNHPAAGERGVETSKLKNNSDTNPKIYKYDVSIYRKDVTTNQIIKTFTTEGSRTTDAANKKSYGDTNDNIFSIIDKNGDSTNGTGDGYTSDEREIEVMIKQRNEYITNQTDISNSIYYTLVAPTIPNTNTNTSSIKNTSGGNNTITLKWTKHTSTGFQTRERISGVETPTTGLTNKEIGIINYRVDISANAPNSKSPFYRLAGGKFTSAPTAQTITGINISNNTEANTYLKTNTGIIHKNDTWSGSTGMVGNVLVFPETTYTINIWSKNIFNIESSTSRNIEIITGSPNTIINQLTSDTIPVNNTYNDIKDSKNYKNKGFLLEDNVDTKPNSIALYQLTKAVNFPSDISANKIHRVNKNKFNDFVIDNDNDKIPTEYVKETNDLHDKKLRQFRIANGDNNIYIFGSDVSFNDISDNTPSTPLSGMIAIASSNVQDEYYNAGDPNNKGYWWKETMTYTITINSAIEALYKKPIKLSLEARYNNQLDSSANFTNSSLDTDGHVFDASRVIFKNTENTGAVIYFDKLNINPGATKKDDSTDIIAYTTTNMINGVPNLYIITGQTYTITLNYKLTNYSEYYGLNNAINFVSHKFKSNSGTDVDITGIAPRSWNSKTNCARTDTGWTINNLVINQGTDSLGAAEEDTESDVRLNLVLNNTFFDDIIPITGSESSIFRFIYDKKSVDEFNDISGSLMSVPSGFNPDFDINTTGKNIDVPSANNFVTAPNALQMCMWSDSLQSYFYSNNGWQTATSISTTNCSNYGMANNLPVFDTGSGYRWVVFHYTLTPSSTFAPYKVLCILGNNTNITNSNLKNTTSPDAKVYLYHGGTMNDYYWFNISQSSSLTDNVASAKNFSYGGEGTDWQGCGDSTLRNSTDSKFNSSSDIAGPGKFTEAFGNSIPKRIIGARFNKITISAGVTRNFYLAIGLKNSSNLYLKKPTLYLGIGPANYQTQQAI